MRSLCLYFQVHQPFRIRKDFSYFAIGTDECFEDDVKNRDILRRVADKCYLPANRLMLELIERSHGKFRIAYSISGVALEQFQAWAPEVVTSFQNLMATGCVEMIGETYYHSLASLFSPREFRSQVKAHSQKIFELFGAQPKTFRNTELIYQDSLAPLIEGMGFRTVLAEGADRILGWRSPNYAYTAVGASRLNILLKNYRLSDDIAFRFSDRQWSEWPLTADRYVDWLDAAAAPGQTVNLFMDYETFGEHQWADSGIFDFLRHLPEAVLMRTNYQFATPFEVSRRLAPVAELSFPTPTSWADTERDVSAWLGNPMQDAAARHVFGLEQKVLATKDAALIHAWRKLQTSDHYYYMCTKWFADGDVHKYFNPFESPYDAFISHANALNQLRWQVETAKRPRSRRPTLAPAEAAPVVALSIEEPFNATTPNA